MKISNRSKLLNYSVGSTAIALLLAVSSAQATLITPGVDISDNIDTTTEVWRNFAGRGGLTLGYSFSVADDLFCGNNCGVDITGLGVFDFNKDGLSEDIEVGVWDSLGALQISGTVAGGGSSDHIGSYNAHGDWRYMTLASAVKLAEGEYTIGALYSDTSTDMVGDNIDILQTINGVTYGQGMRGAIGVTSLTNPNVSVGQDYYKSYFGPTLLIGEGSPATHDNANDIPEPAVIALFGLGLVGMVFARRRQS
jgi:hypothetical protein